MLNESSRPYTALVLGVFATATSAIFIRLAQEADAPSLVIAAGRLIIASLLLTPITLRRYRHELTGLSRRDLWFGIVSGLFLALHFATWISSLEYTSVTASVVLVTTNPLWVALLSLPMLGEKVDRAVMMGIAAAFVGGVVVALAGDAGDPPTRSAPLLGNGLAVLGAIAVAVYMAIGRRLRGKMSLVPYIWLVYSMAALLLSLTVVLMDVPVRNLSPSAGLWILAIALVPQLLGHSAFNYALGYLPAAYVSLVVLAEPIGSSIMAALFLGELPNLTTVLGSAIILVGIGIATSYRRERHRAAAGSSI